MSGKWAYRKLAVWFGTATIDPLDPTRGFQPKGQLRDGQWDITEENFREMKQSMEERHGIEQAQTHLENKKMSLQELMKET